MRTTLNLWTRPGRFANAETDGWAREVDKWFGELVSSPAWAATEETAFRPACDYEETDTHFLFSLDVPGLNKDDIEIEVTGDLLTIAGERKVEARKSEEGRVFSERVFGKFKRQFKFPKGVNADSVEAAYENGVLTVTLAKEEAAKPRKVEIKAGAH